MARSTQNDREFEHPEDVAYFRARLCPRGGRLIRFAILFDFRDPPAKRREFNRRRDDLLRELKRVRGARCQLRLSPDCHPNGPFTVDHLIPLSSNVLNKCLRRMKAAPGCKVPTQSLGSNHMRNLALACGPCNGNKKHRIFPELIRRLVREKFRERRRLSIFTWAAR